MIQSSSNPKSIYEFPEKAIPPSAFFVGIIGKVQKKWKELVLIILRISLVKGFLDLFLRSYYRCTSLGCYVKNHVERASQDMRSTGIIGIIRNLVILIPVGGSSKWRCLMVRTILSGIHGLQRRIKCR